MQLDIEDADSLIDYLRRTEKIGADQSPQVCVLAGGVSNRTVLVHGELPLEATESDEQVRRAAGGWVLKQALPKLRVEVDWFCDPARVHREAIGLRWLARLLPKGRISNFVFEDHDYHLLAMQAVPTPHENWKTQLLGGTVNLAYVEQFAEMLAAIHRISFQRRDELQALFADRSFFETLRLEPYYAFTAANVPAASTFLQSLISDTRRRTLTLVHGDYSPKNVLIYQDQLVLLDHEVVHWGDPAFDVGFSLTHFLSKAHHLPYCKEKFATAAKRYWQHYCELIGSGTWQHEIESDSVRHTLACLLARVDGRSPLEYLNAVERTRQRTVVVQLIQAQPATIDEVVTKFIEGISAHATD